MTTEQKARCWDAMKEAAHEKATSKSWLIRRETKDLGRDLFRLMCEAEVVLVKHDKESSHA